MVAELRLHWKNYVFQSALATLALLLALWVLKLEGGAFSVRGVVIVASLGATGFIVFAMPNSPTARPRNVVAGHVVGLICGVLCNLLTAPGSPYVIIAYAVAVGISIFVMVVIDAEHPPASGTALGVAIAGASWATAIAVVTGAVLLALAHCALRRWLRDLV